ncbi:MAG TPA: IS1634 family transposase [Pilimelia sp.]|nr:IS1634 family transposase [Pilimelia sp.]
MFLREVKRENRNGTRVSYLQLVHNDWDPAARTSRTKILYSFGRTDQVDTAAIERLIVSLSRLLDPAAALKATAGSDLSFICSRPLGGTDVLDGLWRRLGIDTAMTRLLAKRRVTSRFERVLFGLVANRALAPSSKLAAADWITHDVHIDGLPETSDDVCYRSMDWLHDVREHLEREVFGQVANLLNLEVDLLFFDTTSTYFELEDPDEPVARDEHGHALPDDVAEGTGSDSGTGSGESTRVGFRTYGKSKDSRDDLPQIVIGMAVTREGIPVRVWCWPGNTADSKLIRQVKDDMRDWTLSKIVWVADRGFSSERNRRYLRQGDHAYIIGEKLRSDSPEIKAALSRQGRYTSIAENMRVKEVKVSDSERFVICHNPDAAERDAHIRAQLVAQLDELIAGSDKLPVMKRGELRGRISTKPGLNRYLRVTPGGLLRIDKAKIKTEANLDGKYLLRCSDPHLPAADIALGYKQLLEVERGWRDMKQILDLRPVYHRLEERIRAHVVLCWLALLLIRIIETSTGQTWHHIRRDLDRLHAVTFTGPTGTFRQRTDPTKPQVDLYARLDLPLPKKIIEITAAGR